MGSARDLEDIPYHPTLPYANLYTPRINGSELHGLRMVCILKAVTFGWVTKTAPYSLKIDYNRFCDPFEILQAKTKRVFSVRAACPVPRTSNKQSAARVKPTIVTSMCLI